jgi:predicted nucleic acid-binding protein
VRFLIDTNVISELLKPAPSQRVIEWLSGQQPLDVALSVVTLGEIERGATLLPAGARRKQLERWVADEIPRQFQGRILPVDEATAREWGRLSARASTSGRGLSVTDGLLLATAAVHGLTLVTRNEADCAARGVPLFNPWRES